ncbi:DUF1660 family phage protein [Neobacillus drentensis]|uniref:DUF1660 family phage protein n=1 Tax=Neobacillus drentensis TaxID=220684 RepID=UPI003D2F9B12
MRYYGILWRGNEGKGMAYRAYIYENRNVLMYPICRLFGHKWENKKVSILGFTCVKECKRCKSFVYRKAIKGEGE